MSLKKILGKFERFDPKTDCLVMVGEGDRFSFYAPERHSRKAESAEGIPTHVLIALSFAYLAAHPEENRDIVKTLQDRTMDWLHKSEDE